MFKVLGKIGIRDVLLIVAVSAGSQVFAEGSPLSPVPGDVKCVGAGNRDSIPRFRVGKTIVVVASDDQVVLSQVERNNTTHELASIDRASQCELSTNWNTGAAAYKCSNGEFDVDFERDALSGQLMANPSIRRDIRVGDDPQLTHGIFQLAAGYTGFLPCAIF